MANFSILHVLWSSDPVIKLTLLTLIFFSVVSWAIILYKHREIKRFRSASQRFSEAFWKSKNLEELLSRHAGQESPLSNIFRAGITNLVKNVQEGDKESVQRNVERAVELEIERVEKYIPFLATTASSTPFIGLFGTVWGILSAFWQLGKAGSSSLAVVGPSIAEALIATAMGLAAAIPAVIFYNLFATRIRVLLREIQNFGEDLVQRIERDYFKTQ